MTMERHGAKFQRGTFNATILKDSITSEMRRATGRDVLKTKHDLLAANLKDMFSIEELSYVVYSRLITLLEQEYTRALDKMDKAKRGTK